MSDSDLQALETWVEPLLRKLKPAERRKLAGTIARELRRSQAQRIARQENPDGSPFEPRKPQNRKRQGAIRRRAMFSKIRQAKHLKIFTSPSAAEVGFVGQVARIANVHQRGLRDRVDRNGPSYEYPERELLGFTESDRNLVQDLLIAHLT
jgi:phage virion morphogenesis protein